MIHILELSTAEGKSDITAEIKHHRFIFIEMFPACLNVWVCVYLLVIAMCSNVTVIPNQLLDNPGKHQPFHNTGHFCGDDTNPKE